MTGDGDSDRETERERERRKERERYTLLAAIMTTKVMLVSSGQEEGKPTVV